MKHFVGLVLPVGFSWLHSKDICSYDVQLRNTNTYVAFTD